MRLQEAHASRLLSDERAREQQKQRSAQSISKQVLSLLPIDP